MDAPQLPTRREREHAERIRWRRQFAQDIILYGLVFVLCFFTAGILWRLDERSERLYDAVAARDVSSARCP